MNLAMLIGRVGRDPEIRAFDNGSRVASFSLATAKRWKDKDTGERKEKTEWHKIVVWSDGLAKIIEQYVRKGSQLSVTGEIQTRKYQDKDGNERSTTEIVLQGRNGSIELLGGKSDSDRPPQTSSRDYAKARDGAYASDLDDDIPF